MVRPTNESIRSYYEKKYLNDPGGFLPVNKVVSRVIKQYPSHTSWNDVLIKCAVINSLYKTRIIRLTKMASHIIQLDLKEAISSGSPEAVNRIRRNHKIAKKDCNETDLYSFATKYCYSHNRYAFPIYDRNVERSLKEYQKRKKDFSFTINKLKDYKYFLEVLSSFRSCYGLTRITIDQLDKFLWIQGGLM